MSQLNGHHLESSRVDCVPQGDAVAVYTPCHSDRVFLPIEEAAPGAKVEVVCPEGGEGWLVTFAADARAETGLSAVWTQAKPQRGAEGVEGERDDRS
jgi:hypothetical protein